jgi:hypothetical protein
LYQLVTVTESPGIVAISASDRVIVDVSDRVIVDVGAGSAANAAVLATTVSAVAKSMGFMGKSVAFIRFFFLWLATRRFVHCTLRPSCWACRYFREELP